MTGNNLVKKREFWTDSQNAALVGAKDNLLVSASAGSGKTSVLVEKIARYARDGGDIRRLAVMTFTKAAAQEMKERILSKLYEFLRLRPDNQHLKEQIDYLPFADINTIDGYCHGLVRRYFSEIGKDVATEMLSEDEAKMLFDEASDEVIQQAFQSGDEIFFNLLNKLISGRDVKKLKQIMQGLHRFFDAQPEKESFIALARKSAESPFRDRPTTVYLLNRMKRNARLLSARIKDARAVIPALHQKLDACIGETTERLDELGTAGDIYRFAATAAELETGSFTRFAFADLKKAYPEEYLTLQSVRSAGNKFLKSVAEKYSDIKELEKKEQESAAFSALLLRLTVDADLIYLKKKRDDGKQDFADIERLAYRVLSDDARRAEIASQLDNIYVDEYQDTNYLQEAIVLRLSSGDNVFMVGDPKQAIYQFRLAEPKIFVEKYRRFAAADGGRKIDLQENFRSDPKILRFINAVFNPLMTDDFGGLNYAENSQLKPGSAAYPEPAEPMPAVEVCLYRPSPANSVEELLTDPYSVRGDLSETDKKENECAARIAWKIKQIIGKPYYQPKTESFSALKFGDVAVIVATNGQAAEITEVLCAAGIPAVSSGGAKNTENVDILLLNTFLSVADNRQNNIPLATVMASALGGFTSAELAEIRKAQLNCEFWVSVTEYKGDRIIENKINKLFTLLDAIVGKSGFLTVKELLQYALSESGYDAYLLGQADGAERLSQLNAYFYKLDGFDCSFRLKDYLTDCAMIPTDTDRPADDADAVKVMTMHKSKGLEFPVVFVAHTEKTFATDAAKANCLFDKDLGVAVKYFNDDGNFVQDTVATEAIRVKSELEMREERLRLMYVALTRAKNHLYFVGKGCDSVAVLPEECNSFSKFFAYADSVDGALSGYLSDWGKIPSFAPIAADGESVAEVKAELFDGLEAPYAHRDACDLGVKYTVSELNASAEEDFVPTYALQRGGDAETGTMYHKILQHIALTAYSAEDVAAELERLRENGVLTEAEVCAVDRAALTDIMNSETMRLARQGTALREQPFLLSLPANEAGISDSPDKILVQGVIDLLILGEQNVLVDYKVTALSDESLYKRYRTQIELYAVAISRILKVKVDKKIIHILNRNKILVLD